MMLVWEPADIKPGMKIATPQHKERGLIIYSYDNEGNKIFTIVSISNGLVSAKWLSESGMAEHLFNNGYVPVELFDVPTTNASWSVTHVNTLGKAG